MTPKLIGTELNGIYWSSDSGSVFGKLEFGKKLYTLETIITFATFGEYREFLINKQVELEKILP